MMLPKRRAFAQKDGYHKKRGPAGNDHSEGTAASDNQRFLPVHNVLGNVNVAEKVVSENTMSLRSWELEVDDGAIEGVAGNSGLGDRVNGLPQGHVVLRCPSLALVPSLHWKSRTELLAEDGASSDSRAGSESDKLALDSQEAASYDTPAYSQR